MRRNDVDATSFRRRVPTRFLINQCQIITFLILKYDIENSKIELRGIVLPVQVGGLLWGQRVCCPPLSNYWGAWPPPPPPPAPPPPLFLRLWFRREGRKNIRNWHNSVPDLIQAISWGKGQHKISHHQRHHQRQPGEQPFPIQVAP